MDKIREAFETRAKNMGYDLTKRHDGTYDCYNTLVLETGYLMAVEDYKSRDEEIKKLRDALEKKNKHIEIVIGCLDKPKLWDYSEKFVHGYMRSMKDELKEALEETDER